MCEVCWTFQRLNRVILTRHPAEESPTLLKLLQRLVGKVEAFIEEHEANQTLGRGQIGGLPLGTLTGVRGTSVAEEAIAPGLTPAAKRSTRPSRSRAERSLELSGRQGWSFCRIAPGRPWARHFGGRISLREEVLRSPSQATLPWA